MKEKEKTALQQVYDLLDEGCIGQVLKDRAELLNLEKRQHEQTFDKVFYLGDDERIYADFEQYFTDTYE